MRIFVVAGEASGDRLGAALMAGLKQLESVEFQGVGGPLMEAEGLRSLFPIDELSLVGLVEILPRYPHLRRRLYRTAEAALEAAPDVLITIDSPDFCLRLAKLVKAKSSIRTVHYVSPSVWAWRSGRARRMARHIDHVLALLPFEPPLMEAHGMECDFVGHPVVSEPVPDAAQVRRFAPGTALGTRPSCWFFPARDARRWHGLGRSSGGRFRRFATRIPTCSLWCRPRRAPSRCCAQSCPSGRRTRSSCPPSDMKSDDYKLEKICAFHGASWALAASGTVSLELAAADTPMVIAYDVHPLSRAIISRMLKVDTLTLVNLVSGTRTVPELLGADCRAERIAPAVLRLMADPGEQLSAMRLTIERLGRGGEAPGLRAARAVLARL